MSYSYAFRPKVEHPNLSNQIPQMASGCFQTPFFFGGSQVPHSLGLSKSIYNGSSGSGFHKGSIPKVRPTDLDFTTKNVDKVFQRKGHLIKLAHTMPFMK